MRAARLAIPFLALLAVLAPVEVAFGQKLRDKTKPANDPVQCPYCHGDPTLMTAVGVVSHGGFEFSKTDTAEIDGWLGENLVWIETAHFEIGFGIGPHKVETKEKEKIRGELGRLAEALPEVKVKTKILDPWLRAHVFAQRVENLWRQMIELLGVDEAEFPAGTRGWDQTGTYMGEGPYLGQKGKYEILILPSEAASKAFLRREFGLSISKSQRYNVIERDTLILVMHTQQGGMRADGAIHGHVAFNLSQMFVNGYKHYTYDSPVWLLEGLAHWMERSISPRYNSFDAAEGSGGETTTKEDWEPPTKKIVKQGKAPRMAQLMAMRGHADLSLEAHFTTWSIVDYFQKEKPGFLGTLLARIKGITNAEGYGDGSTLPDVHREVFKTELGQTYAQFDTTWTEWVLANY